MAEIHRAADPADDSNRPAPLPALAVVVMGVAGSGKSAVGEALAKRLGATFVEGDRLHPAANVARMEAGEPLRDADRAGWLDAIGAEMEGIRARGSAVVASCSALKRIYRDRLRAACPGVVFVHLELDEETARDRVARRKGHFMPPSLVRSQFMALERPQSGEAATVLDGRRPIARLVAEAARAVTRVRSA